MTSSAPEISIYIYYNSEKMKQKKMSWYSNKKNQDRH